MKFYIKVFLISFVGFLALFTGILFAIDAIVSRDDVTEISAEETTETTKVGDSNNDGEVGIDDNRTELQKIAEASSRINIIAFGLNEHLADTMMLFSYDPDLNKIDILSIPRDTYNHIEGFNDLAQKKMNAVFGFPEVGGVDGMKKILSEFLGVPIHYYLKVDFEAVESIVNTLGGYEVNVPFDMDYDDFYDTPPLRIHFKEGYQVLNGADSVRYLRFRKNNDGSRSEGDIQRIPRQQHFVNTMMNKALSSKLPSVINTVIGGEYVTTDMTLEEALGLAIKGASLKSDAIQFYTLEGEARMISGSSYWIHDPASLETTLYSFYGFSTGNEEAGGTIDDTSNETTEETSGN